MQIAVGLMQCDTREDAAMTRPGPGRTARTTLGNPIGPCTRGNAGLNGRVPWRRVLSLFAASAFALVPGEMTLGQAVERVHEDWRIRVLQADGTRTCYAETSALEDDTVDALRDTRLQAIGPWSTGRADVRLSDRGPEPDGTFVLAVGDSSPWRVRTDNSIRGAGIVEQLKSGEAAGLPAMLLHEQGEVRASYSLSGFAAAHDAISEVCSEDTPGYQYPFASVSALSFAEDEQTCFTLPAPDLDHVWVHDRDIELIRRQHYSRGGRCLEFSIEGPFWEATRTGRIEVKLVSRPYGFGDPPTDRDGNLYGPNEPWLWLVDGIVADLYVDDVRVGMLYADHLEPRLCHDERSGKAKLYFKSVSMRAWNIRFGHFDDTGRLAWSLASAWESSSAPDCSNGGTAWAWGESFLPCTCAGVAAHNSYLDSLRALVSDIEFAGASETGIAEQQFAEWMDRLDRLDFISSLVRLYEDAILEGERLDSPDYSVTVLTYRSPFSYREWFQHVFARRNGPGETWHRVYVAPLWSGAFQTVDVLGFLNHDTLDVEMCIENCTNDRARRERVRLSVEDLLSGSLADD